jgi:8-oxo-dGTP diphosphatase
MPGYWNLPGGGLKEGESPGRAAARECMEESGIKPLRLTLWQRIEKPFIDLYVYRSECDEDAEVLLDPFESTDYAWIGLERLDSIQFVPDCKEWIRIALMKSPPIGVINNKF